MEWILIADASRARVFEYSAADDAFDEIDDAANPRSREHDTDIVSDGNDRTGSRGGSGPASGYEPATSPVEHANDQFARQLADLLFKAYTDHRYTRLRIAAAPEFLGRLRVALAKPVRATVIEEIAKDWTREPADALRGHFFATRD